MAVVGVEKTPVGPIAGGGEKGEHYQGAVDAWPVKEVG